MPPKKSKQLTAMPELTGKALAKEKKLRQKYGDVKYEDHRGKIIYAMSLRRDELELAAEKLQEQVALARSERIRFQLERDFLKDVATTYAKRYKCILAKQEHAMAKNTAMLHEMDNSKTVNSIAGKHFRYDVQICSSQMDARDEVRSKMLKQMLDQSWQFVSMEIDELDVTLRNNSLEYMKKIDETKVKLQDEEVYKKDHEEQIDQFTTNLGNEMKSSLNLFKLQRRVEIQATEERWNEFIYALTVNFEADFDEMKKHYDLVTNYNLKMIFDLQKDLTETQNNISSLEKTIDLYNGKVEVAGESLPDVESQHRWARVSHLKLNRSKDTIQSLNKELESWKMTTNRKRYDYRQLLRTLARLDEEKAYYKNQADDILSAVQNAYHHRFNDKKEEESFMAELAFHEEEKKRLLSHFETEQDMNNFVNPLKAVIKEKDAKIEEETSRCMRIEKQYRDLRNALEERMKQLGPTFKHKTVTEEGGVMIGRTIKQNYAPANLIGNLSYPVTLKKPFSAHLGTPKIEDPVIEVCLTESIRGFLAWKDLNSKKNKVKEEDNLLTEEEEATQEIQDQTENVTAAISVNPSAPVTRLPTITEE